MKRSSWHDQQEPNYKIYVGKLRIVCILFIMLAAVPLNALSSDLCDTEALKSELKIRADKDQHLRKSWKPGLKLSDDTILQDILALEKSNAVYIPDLLQKCGWPKKSVVGEDTALHIWLLVQHLDNHLHIQNQAAVKMWEAVAQGEASNGSYSALIDRNRRNSNLPQVYGFQTYNMKDRIEFYQIVTPGLIDERRKRIGLPSFYCWTLQLSGIHPDLEMEWPQGVPYKPEQCDTK
ncbi:DUF6624 domain-containing protein [Simiduia agarivorans]|uniref:Uncharacterized protein n=1 Tax=Simiduia agarivorans (strain DSM 21679 / JCM 13881 / BCRC 17597 / SA1) TaxID=1117647 RepID=K4KHY9_SIMAS|nr:DUF6624 domain-containing protein [Simiduia agarivorans]AFU98724.1 hypothetical protein M5M_07665 [Simiduia agarivorans SA1 = DSM 21679]